MATSSIGRPVVLDEESAKRLIEILKRPHKPAHSISGGKLELSHFDRDPKKFK